MKKLSIIILALLVGAVYGQESKVPAQVKAKFKALHPNADEVKWDVEDNDYEVTFESEEDVDMSLLFDAKGNIIETESEIEEDDLPSAVKSSVENNFKGWELGEAAKIVRDGKTTYEAELEKGEKKIDAIFTADGKLVKKISKKENDEENEKAESGEKDEENEEEK